MKLDLNFASRRYINRKALNKSLWLIATGLLCLLAWLIIQNLLVWTNIQQSRNQLTILKQDRLELLGTESISLDNQRIEEIRLELSLSQELLARDAFRWTALFDKMEELLPAGVSIRSFSPDYEKRSLAMTGVARDLSELRILLDRLLESESITNVLLKDHSQVTVQDVKGTKYDALSFSVSLEGVF